MVFSLRLIGPTILTLIRPDRKEIFKSNYIGEKRTASEPYKLTGN